MNAYLNGMRRYLDFEGRATIAQFWQFVLAVTVLLLAAAFVDGIVGAGRATAGGPVTLVVGIAHFLPFVAISVRRLHDTDRSGWWYLINAVPLGFIVFIVLMCIPSTPGDNAFGPPVDAREPDTSFNIDSYRQPDFFAVPPASVESRHHVSQDQKSAADSTTGLSRGTVIERLERLARLRASGTIDEVEFQGLKAKLLNVNAQAGGL